MPPSFNPYMNPSLLSLVPPLHCSPVFPVNPTPLYLTFLVHTIILCYLCCVAKRTANLHRLCFVYESLILFADLDNMEGFYSPLRCNTNSKTSTSYKLKVS
jgi:hypothetical protein